MRRLPLLILAVFSLALTAAAQYPSEWRRYTSPGFLYDIQSGQNDRDMSETAFRNYLTDLARTNIARSVRMNISDRAEMSRQSTDGRTTMDYSSVTLFSTDVELSLVKTESAYDRTTKAGETLGKMKDRVAEARTDLFMLNFFGAPEKELSEMSGTVNAFLAAAGKLETELGRGTLLRLQCSSDDMDCREFEKTLKGHLSKMDCSFTDNTEEAAWTIEVGLDIREYNISEMGGMKIYTAYADALLTLEKRTGARKSVEDRVSEKGVHTLSYAEAGRDACARLGEALAERIYSIISQ